VCIPVSQFDSLWQFQFTLVESNQRWTIPDGATAVMNGKKPDGNTFSFSGTISQNVVEVDCDVQMTAVAGNTECELSILSAGKVVGTTNFTLVVEAAPKAPGDISSETTLPAYGEILERIAELEAGGGSSVTVDAALSASSENPVQNKAVKAALDNKADANDIPTKTSELTNDSGFLTAAPVTSVAGRTGVVVLGKGDVGLGNVDNTSDASKPVSTAQQTALDGKEDKTSEVTVSTAGAVTQALDAGKLYHFTGALTSLTITLNASVSGKLAHYHFDFDSGSTAPTFSLPQTVTMPSGFSVEASKHYEIDILNNYGAVMSW